MVTSFSANVSASTSQIGCQHIIDKIAHCQRMSMQEKESIMVVRCKLKIPSLGITAQYHSASLVMPSSYPRDRIFNPHLTAIKDSYNLLKL